MADEETEMEEGKASVWFCDPFHWSATHDEHGCGFFGFYKPETDAKVLIRKCPACGKHNYYDKTGDLAVIIVIKNGIDDVVAIDPEDH